MKANPLYSMALSLAIHLPLMYGFQTSFFDQAASKVENKEPTAIYYQTERSVQRRAVVKTKGLAPREGHQVRLGEKVSKKNQVVRQSNSEQVSGRHLKIPSHLKKLFKKAKQKTKVQRRVFVPTVENLNLESPEKKRIFFQYYDLIRKKIKDHTIYPYQAKVGVLEGDSYISFVLKRSGHIRKIILLESSGFPLLDDAAMNSIRNAEPFPPFPENLIGNDVKLNIPISFRLD